MASLPRPPRARFGRSLDLRRGRVEMLHGNGGMASAQLIEELIAPAFDNPWLARLDDQAALEIPSGRLVLSTDSHVVTPIFFPGGDIGSLAVYGTVNDVAVGGATPLYLSVGLILEEGFPLAQLDRVVRSMARAGREAGVALVTGDTKVVERGHGDGIFINTTGIGERYAAPPLTAGSVRPGDAILLSGPVGDHGIAILAAREELSFETTLESDVAPLTPLTQAVVASGAAIRCMRDLTRGGLAAALNEIAHASGTGMMLDEAAIPVREPVRGACELLGLDPLHVACEGRLVAFCAATDADQVLRAMRETPGGEASTRVGEVIDDPRGFVQLQTGLGGLRMIDWISGDQLPRIC